MFANSRSLKIKIFYITFERLPLCILIFIWIISSIVPIYSVKWDWSQIIARWLVIAVIYSPSHALGTFPFRGSCRFAATKCWNDLSAGNVEILAFSQINSDVWIHRTTKYLKLYVNYWLFIVCVSFKENKILGTVYLMKKQAFLRCFSISLYIFCFIEYVLRILLFGFRSFYLRTIIALLLEFGISTLFWSRNSV